MSHHKEINVEMLLFSSIILAFSLPAFLERCFFEWPEHFSGNYYGKILGPEMVFDKSIGTIESSGDTTTSLEFLIH